MQILGELEKKLLDYKLRYKLALKKKIEMMKLKYEKCMSLRVFKEPMQQINEKYILIQSHILNEEYVQNLISMEKYVYDFEVNDKYFHRFYLFSI